MGFIYTKSGKLAKRLYFGAVLLFEGLYYTFKNRVLADGGTFLENELPTISQDAKLVLTPNAYKAGKFYSAVPNDGTGDFTVDRNSTATYVDEDGLIKTALANVPRIEDGAILIEPQRTNLITYSEDFNNVVWRVRTGMSKIGGQMSPNNSLSAFLITNNGANDGLFFSYPNPEVGKTYTLSFYVKGTGNNSTVKLIANGSYPVSGNEITLGGNWQRVQHTFLVNISSHVGMNISENGGGSVLVWGAQVEEGTEATSYIPNDGTTVTRLADNISVPTPAGVTSITETIDGVEQTPITTIPTTYSLPVGNINKVTMK